MSSSPSAPRRRFLPAVLAVVALVPLVFALGSARAQPTELFFSEYIEGSSNNKALEIYNGTGAPVDLAPGTTPCRCASTAAARATLTIALTGTVAAGDVYVLAHASAEPAILGQADQTNGSGWFNGNDAVVLRKGSAIVDSIGQIGFDPGTRVGHGTDEHRRQHAPAQAARSTPATRTASDAFDPAVEWDGFANDTFDGLGCHTIDLGDRPPTVTARRPRTTRRRSPSTRTSRSTFSEAVAVTGVVVHDLLHDERRALGRGQRRPDDVHARPGRRLRRAREACTVTIVASPGHGPGRERPARHDGGRLQLQLHDCPVEIHDVQGAAHLSPSRRALVSGLAGVVTAKLGNGFYLQDPTPDANDATSEAIFVFTSSAPTVAVGDDDSRAVGRGRRVPARAAPRVRT